MNNNKLVDFRSDTKTLPTEEILAAMKCAELGDSKADEDPTVNRLEKMAAERFGKESAMLVISSTMANLLSHLVLCGTGNAILLDPETHVFVHEGGSFNLMGMMPSMVKSDDGLLSPETIEKHIKNLCRWVKPRLLHLENTHVMSGGRVVPLDLHVRQCEIARQHNLSIHLDGARIFNAEIATGTPVAEYAKQVDSVLFCLSKNLCCPLGSVLLGTKEFIKEAKYYRTRIGGGMRQAGVIAAAGIYAMENMIDRLKTDHDNAKYLADKLNAISSIKVDLRKVESNMIKLDISASDKSLKEIISACAEQGVLVGSYPPEHLRFVTHKYHTEAIIDDAVKRLEIILNNL